MSHVTSGVPRSCAYCAWDHLLDTSHRILSESYVSRRALKPMFYAECSEQQHHQRRWHAREHVAERIPDPRHDDGDGNPRRTNRKGRRGDGEGGGGACGRLGDANDAECTRDSMLGPTGDGLLRDPEYTVTGGYLVIIRVPGTTRRLPADLGTPSSVMASKKS